MPDMVDEESINAYLLKLTQFVLKNDMLEGEDEETWRCAICLD